MRKIKMINCPVCNRTFKRPNYWCDHILKSHPDQLPEGFTPLRYMYALITGKYKGTCMYCGDETEWNEATGKYGRLCGSKDCRDKYAEEHQLASPDKQREMLAKRKISKEYLYGEQKVKMMYTGTYELKFLQYLDNVLNWPVTDIMAPSPNTYYYNYVNPEDKYHEGKKFYIPDFYIPSLNLEIEIKDQTTTHPKFLKIDKVKEACKDKRMRQLKYKVNYIKINNNNFNEFMKVIEDLKATYNDDEMKHQLLYPSEESFIMNSSPIVPYAFPMSYELLVRFWGKKKADEIMKDPSKVKELRQGFESVLVPIRNQTDDRITDELKMWVKKTGIAVIHPCDTEEELNKLYNDWLVMTPENRDMSERMSWERYGMGNIQHYNILKMGYRQIRHEIQPISLEGFVKNYVMNKFIDLFEIQENLYAMLHNDAEDIAFDTTDKFIQFQETCLSKYFEEVYSYKIFIQGTDINGESIEVNHTISCVKDHIIEFYIYIESILDKEQSGVYISRHYNNFICQVIKNLISRYNIKEVDLCEYSLLGTNVCNSIDIIEDISIDKLNDPADIFMITNYYAKESIDDGFIADNICVPAMESIASLDNYNPMVTWYQKMFIGKSIEDMYLTSPTNKNKGAAVKIEDGKIYISRISVYNLFNRLKRFYHTKNIKNIFMIEYNEKSLIKYYKKKINRSQLKIDSIWCPEFFALELVEIFNDLGRRYRDKTYREIAEIIYNNTWLSKADNNTQKIREMKLDNLENLDLKLLPYQEEFIKNYERLKCSLNLNGYVLAFEQGLGKTVTSTALAECGEFEHVYIVCPNSVCANWALELRKYYKKYQENEDIWRQEVILCKDKKDGTNGRFFIVNNESINAMLPYVKKGKNLLIVDECHNFRNLNGKRTDELIQLDQKINSNDKLMLSGTPIKAIPNEISPILRLIDPLFTEDAAKLYVKAFNIDNTSASNMINKRFGKFIYRKTKEELPDLPDKNIEELFYSVANPKPYLVSTLRAEIWEIFEETFNKKLVENDELMKEFINYIKKYSSTTPERTAMYCKWLTTVNTNKKMKLHDSEMDMIVDFLPTYVYPNIINREILMNVRNLEVKFLHMKNSALSYAIGQVLPPARKNLFINIFDENLEDIIQKIVSRDKKTVIFSQFKPVVNHIHEVLNKNNINTVKITGDITTNRVDILSSFQNDDTVRVIVATSATIGTGVNLFEASQMFFFGTPWRESDFNQCCDRIHRIGQTDDVDIRIVLLESEDELNVSTRMNDIMNWSREMFNSAITVTENDHDDIIDDITVKLDTIERTI